MINAVYPLFTAGLDYQIRKFAYCFTCHCTAGIEMLKTKQSFYSMIPLNSWNSYKDIITSSYEYTKVVGQHFQRHLSCLRACMLANVIFI